MNKKIIFFISGLIVFLIFGLSAWWFWPREEIVIPEPAMEKNEFADWQTYRNEEYGFEIKYPPNFKKEVSNNEFTDDKSFMVRFLSPEQLQTLERWDRAFGIAQIRVYESLYHLTGDDQISNIEEWMKDDDFPIIQGSKRDIIISGEKAIEAIATGYTPYRVIYLQHNSRVYLFSGGAVADEKAVLNQILSTFKFID